MKTNLKGLLAVAKTIFSSSCTRFSVVLLSCLLWTSIGRGQTITGSNPYTVNYTTAGSFTWTCPAGVTTITVECWGGGGGGGGVWASSTKTQAGGGGAGGGYVKYVSYTVIPGNNYSLTVGASGSAGLSGSTGSNNGGTGGNSSFNSAIIAAGGSGGTGTTGTGNFSGVGGTAGTNSCTGCSVNNSGGNGAGGLYTTPYSGAGGGSAGSGSVGGNASSSTGGTAGTSGGVVGASGITGNVSSAGIAGGSPGAGGSGALDKQLNGNKSGGSGGVGKILITYTLPVCSAPTSLATSVSSSVQTNTSISCSFTAASSAPSGYIVVRSTSATQPTTLSLGTTLPSVGNTSAFGAGTYVEYAGTSAGSWVSTGLLAGTIYYYYVFCYNNTSCSGGPAYSTSATSFSQSTAACTGAALTNLSYTSATNTYCTGTAITTNTATLGTTSGVPTYSISPALPTGLSLNASTGAITGTPTTAQSATNYSITVDNGCTNTTTSISIEILTSPSAPSSAAASSITFNGFTANWITNGATSYLLDVATDASFTNLVSGFNALNVGNVATYVVSGLNSGITYYYRVRALSGSCISANSTSQTVLTTLISSLTSGDWNATTTWNSGTVPTCGDIVTIASTHTVTVNSSSNVSKNLTINSGGTLVIASGDLTVGCTLNNTPLTNNGILTVNGGVLNVNGNLVCNSGATFNQSGGDINIDGNNGGTAATSSSTALLSLNTALGTVNGGTITIIDPPATTAATKTISYSVSTTSITWTPPHTLKLGDGISTTIGGNTNGFELDCYLSTGRLVLGNVIVNGGNGNNRWTSSSSSTSNGTWLNNLTINSGSEFRDGSATYTYILGNITNNGILTNQSAILRLAGWNTSSNVEIANANSQTISGSGTFRNSTTSSTANLSNLTVNNSNATGVTLAVPLSLSGTLTMTAGKINTTATNLLTLGTTTAAGTLAYTAGQIVGPLARTFAASRTTTGTYTVATLFPVGDGTNYIPIHIDPTTSAGGPVVMLAQEFNTNSGTAGSGVASTLSSDRWEALVSSGSANLTSCFIGLNDAQIASGNVIAQSSSASGTYNAVSGTSTYTAGTPNSLRTGTAIPAASYTGYFTYAAPGPVITSFTPTSACPNAATTITITGTNLSSATSVTLNGEACTITNNTATSITVTTDATPQAGNIVVTTAANSATSPSAMTLFTLPTVTASSNAANNTLCSGTSVTLNGGGATSYTWNNSVTNNVAFTPSTSTTYTVTGTDGSNGCTNTASITLTVNQIVAIASQPASQVVLPNATATFSVSASGTGLSYQWEELVPNGTWTAIANTGIYSGATSNALVLTGVTSGNSGNQYRVVITGTAPCTALTSNAATLTISTTAIANQPQNQTICTSSGTGTASFSITTTGTTPTYQWQVSTNGGTSWTDIAGETNASLSLSGLTLSDSAKQYRCQLNSGAVISNVAILTVYGVPTINTQPSNLTVCSNATSGNFTVAATGSNLSYQWQRSTDAGATWSNISGATTNTLSFTSYTNAMDGYQYKVIVSGSSPCSTATSNVVTLNVTGILSVAASSATTCANSAITLTATPTTSASGLNYSWSSTTGSGATSAVTTNPASITPTAAGTYTYTLATTGGAPSGGCTFSNTVNVSVNSLPNSVTASSNNTTICLGSSINLTSVSSSSNLLNVIGDGGFETGATFPLNNWTVVNGSNNIWSVGSSAGVQAGSNAALIGTGNVATANASVNHFYRDIVIPVGSTNINLSFYLKMAIVDNTYDYLNVYTTTTSNIPVAGTLPSTGYTSVFSNTATVYSTFTSQSITLPNSLAGTTVRLVFTYKCDGVSPYSAPAVDNVSLSAIPASSYSWNSNPTGFTSSVQNPTGVSPTTNTTYTVTSTNSFGCTSSNSVSVTVNPTNTASTASSTPTLCANTALTAITHTTTGATGISSAGVSGANTLPAGVSATWANNTITISGTPTSAGTFNYSIPLTGGCGSVNATGTITVNALPTTSVLTGTLACAGSTGTISSSTSQSGVNYQLYDASNTAVGSAIAGTGSSLTWSSLPIANGYYVIGTNATSSCVSANSNAVAVGTITNKTWTGATSNDWSTASNWSCGTLPTSSDVIIINTSNPAPVMGADFTVGATGSLTISGTGSLIISPSKTLTIAGAVNFGGKSVTLKSDSVGTARIATITGSLTNATNVTQERYVPGKAVRRWSFLASPVTQLLSSAWQQQIHITGPGTGGTMCNNYTISGTMTPHSNGFDVTQLQNPSFYTYDAATDNFVANTSGTNSFTLSPGNGYMVLVRGDRNDATNGGCVLLSANNQAAFTSIPVTLAATGAVGQGTITKVLPVGYSFIGNPYPCELDFSSFNTTNASVISGGYWTYYPTNATYTFSTFNNGTSTNGGTQVIANGQSFLVNSTNGGTITFNEAHKSTTANNGNFRLTKTWDELLRVGLLNNQNNRFDEVVIRFGNDAAITKSINEYDAASVNAGDQWIKTLKDATELAIQTRPNTYQNDTVALAIHAKNAGTYQLGFSEYQGLSNTDVYLIDQQENLIQNVKALPSYDFSVAANTTTANRFKLIFNAKTSGVGSIASNTQLQVYPNPTKDKVSITCNSLEYGAYQVKVRTITGAEVLQAKGFYKNGDVIELSLTDLAAGMYLLELNQDNGFRATQKITKH
jgi:hypothetical protein